MHTMMTIGICMLAAGLFVCVAASSNTCVPVPLEVPSISLGVSIYPNNISYVSFALEPTAASDFNISFDGFSSNANITVYVGTDYPCPDPSANYLTLTGPSVTFYGNNPLVKTYYFGITYAAGFVLQNTTWVTALLSVGCPDWCNGAGAMCDSQTGCMCRNNYYNSMTGCNVTGVCDPFMNDKNMCTLPQFNSDGYGYQSCDFTDSSRSTTQWGPCNIAFCNPGYIVDSVANKCVSNTTTTTSSSGGTSGKGNYQLPVTKGEFIGIVLGVAFFLIILSTVITYSVMRRKNNYQTIH